MSKFYIAGRESFVKCLSGLVLVSLLFVGSLAYGQNLTITKSNAPTGNVQIGSTITYTIEVASPAGGQNNVVISDAAPPNTTFVPGSAIHIAGVAPVVPNPASPVWTVAALVVGQSTTVRFQVTVNSGLLQGTMITNTASALSTQQPVPVVSNSVSNTVVVQLSNTACSCLNDASPNNNNGSYRTTLIVKDGAGVPLSSGLNYSISASTGLFQPDGNSGPGATGGPANAAPFSFCNGFGCPLGVSNGQYYKEVDVPNNGNFTVTVTGPAGVTLSLSQSACNAYPALPTIPIPDVACLSGITNYSSGGNIYNRANNTNNILLYDGFSQIGTGSLVIDPNALNSAQLPYSIYLIREVGGCQVSAFKQDFEVFKAPNATLEDTIVQCVSPGDVINLGSMFTAVTTAGGNYTVGGVALPVGSSNYTIPASGGCFQVQYEATHPSCPSAFDTEQLYITLKPEPAYNISSSSASPVCLAQGSHIITINKSSNGFNPVLTVSPAATINGNISSGSATISLPAPSPGASVVYTVCLEERTNIGPINCGSNPNPDNACIRSICKRFTVFNDGYSCGANNIFNSQCPEPFQPDVCEIEVNPGLTLSCGSIFSISTPDLFTSDLSTDQGVLNCTDTELTGMYNISLLGLDFDSGSSGQTLGSFPGLSIVCSIFNFCLDLGFFEICPLKALADAIGCNKTIAQFIFDLISTLVGGDGGGAIVVADTDGDGGFDFDVADGPFPLGPDNFSVPNRVAGSGYITVRAIGGWPFAPIDVCGQATPDGPNLLDLLPIGSIPIVGAVIEDILAALQCNIPLAWSSEATVQIPVFSRNPPDFVNFNEAGYVFANTLACGIASNWSIPVAIDPCDKVPIQYRGVTNTVDLSFYGGQNPPTPVVIDQAGVYQTGGPIPGSILPPDVYTITYLAVSCNGNPTSRDFQVVVTSGNPILECPNDITVQTDADQCTAEVNGLAPYQGIGCASILNYTFVNPVSGIVVTSNSNAPGEHSVPDGYHFELGATVITDTMQVDINGDGDFDDANETQTCQFTITVVDRELPEALCADVEVKLDNTGQIVVYANQQPGNEPFINAGSLDNCDDNPTIQIAKSDQIYGPALIFDCSETGINIVNLRVTDAAMNSRTCIARVDVVDFLDDIYITMDLPELCLEANNPEQLNFANYMTITLPNGTYLTHEEVASSNYMGNFAGGFGISGFIPFPGTSSADPGTITPDGLYTPGTGSGYVVVSYILYLEDPNFALPENQNPEYYGCITIHHAVFEQYQPLDMESPECACVEEHVRIVDLGILSGGLEPYTIQYGDGVLDLNGDGIPEDTDGEYTYDESQGHTITDFMEDLGDLRITYNPFSNWSFTIVDARGCELFRSGSCDNDDLTEKPSVICPPNPPVLFTEPLLCESQFEWQHPLPSDNCAVVLYNYQITNPDGTIEGPFTLDDLLNIAPGSPLAGLFEAEYEFQKGISSVFYYVEDAVGNLDTCSFQVSVLDDDPPYFINCPYPPVVENAETDHCDAYVNFALPLAEDNCDVPVVTQIDDTGLTTGDRFPVGTTVMYWEAVDLSNNRDTCQVKVIVNDYWQTPAITCPGDVLQNNDLWLCGAEVFNIAPVVESPCQDNLAVTYSIYADEALTERIACGVWDASGEFFVVGDSYVRYKVSNQPLLLISEVTQSGGLDQLEITNLGPAEIDLTCLVISRKTGNPLADETIGPITLLPSTDGIPLGVGQVKVFDFTFDAPANLAACYTISYMDVIIDEVAVNGQAGCGDFTGTLNSGDVIRICEDDSNDAADWVAAELCAPLTIGMLNPDLEAMPDNGTKASLQSIPPNAVTCVFEVLIKDNEDPFCGQFGDVTTYTGGAINPISPTACNRSGLIIPDTCIIGQLEINIVGTANPTNSTITLISPQGIEVNITELPQDSIEALFTQKSGGEWILDIVPNLGQNPNVTSWSLTITCMDTFDLADQTLDNDPGLCGAEFTWVHPWFVENCFEGTIAVEYITTDADCTPPNGPITGKGGYEETQFFCVGTTTVKYTLIDTSGNIHMCMFNVTVLDVEDPEVVCPGDIFVNLDPGLCRSIVCYVPESATDNCEVVDTIYEPPFCTEFEIGIHDVTITVVDEAGNEDECSFQVHIIEYIPPTDKLVCNDLVQVSLGVDCESEILADDILEGNEYRCYENYNVIIYNGLTSNLGILPSSPFVNQNHIGDKLLVQIVDPGSGNSCWGFIQIEDKLAPSIDCPADTVILCSVPTDPAVVGQAELTSCEKSYSIIFDDDVDDFGICQDPRAVITRTWIIEDESGNTNSCEQIITVEAMDLANIVFPSNYDGIDQPYFNCADVQHDPVQVLPYYTGEPTIGGFVVKGDDNFCPTSVIYTDDLFPICGGSYDVLRTWKVYNPCQPAVPGVNPLYHTQVIKVVDLGSPDLKCPKDITVSLLSNYCYAENFTIPDIGGNDFCATNLIYEIGPDNGLTITTNGGQYPGKLPIGVYDFVYKVRDDCGNQATCVMVVNVVDNVAPAAICETLHQVALNNVDGISEVNAISFDDGSVDNCGILKYEVSRMNDACDHNSNGNVKEATPFAPTVGFCCEDIGDIVMVAFRVTDVHGQSNTCMVEVTVVDKQKPLVWCPPDVTVNCDMAVTPVDPDTFVICKKPLTPITDVWASKYVVPIDITGLPEDAVIRDLDLKLDILHEKVDQLEVTLISPYGKKAKVITKGSCTDPGFNNLYSQNILVTLNDEAYDLIAFNNFNKLIPAPYTCTVANPGVGSYNEGHMQPKGDYLSIFDGTPVNSLTAKNQCFRLNVADINAATNRVSNLQVSIFIAQMGLKAGDDIVLNYSDFNGTVLPDLNVGSPYLFKVIDAQTLEFIDVLGADIVSVPVGSNHNFCATNTWLLVVEDTEEVAGGVIFETCLSIEYGTPLTLVPHVLDNASRCGLEIDYQDLGDIPDCEEGQFINRRWRAEDASGNNSSCIQRIYFDDPTELTIQFPCDVTVDCSALNDTISAGFPIHNADCEVVGIEYVDEVLETSGACFKVLRTWIVKEWCTYTPDGIVDLVVSSIDADLEVITFTTSINSLIQDKKLRVGDRVTLKYVTSGSAEIGGMVEKDGYSATYVGGTSFKIDINTTKQQTVNITSAGTGPHIFRYVNTTQGIPVICSDLEEWYPLVDWHGQCPSPQGCRGWEDDGDGYFTFTQTIMVNDDKAPAFVNCVDLDFCSYDESCVEGDVNITAIAEDECTAAGDLAYSFALDLFADGTVDSLGTGNVLTGMFTMGTHKVSWKASDHCGNVTTCTQNFTIKDCKKPTPICHPVSVDLMLTPDSLMNGTAQVWAKSLEAGDSYDNCTSYSDLLIRVIRVDQSDHQTPPTADAVTVTCADLIANPGVVVEVWVGDKAGNWDFCTTTITVEDNLGACGSSKNVISGTVVNKAGEAIEDVEMNLSGSSTAQQMSTALGSYGFNNLDNAGFYIVTPIKDVQPLNGVSTYDLLLMQKHILGIKSFTHPHEYIAGDVNNTCSISVGDIVGLRKMILAPQDNFPDNTSWRFVEENYVFPKPNKPCQWQEFKQFEGLDNFNIANFNAIKVGDINGDHKPNTLIGSEVRNIAGDLTFLVNDLQLSAGEEQIIEVTAENFTAIQGYQYTMELDPSRIEILDIDARWTDLSRGNFGLDRQDKGLITTSWNSFESITLEDGTVLFTIKVKARENCLLSQVFQVNSHITRAEAYDVEDELLDVRFRFDSGLVIGGDFALYQNVPNPFNDITRIGFELPERGEVVLTVHDITGKVVYRMQNDFARGYNEIVIRSIDLVNQGMLYYTLQSGEHIATMQMTMQE